MADAMRCHVAMKVPRDPVEVARMARTGMMDYRIAADDHETDFILQAQAQEIFEVCRQSGLCQRRVSLVFQER